MGSLSNRLKKKREQIKCIYMGLKFPRYIRWIQRLKTHEAIFPISLSLSCSSLIYFSNFFEPLTLFLFSSFYRNLTHFPLSLVDLFPTRFGGTCPIILLFYYFFIIKEDFWGVSTVQTSHSVFNVTETRWESLLMQRWLFHWSLSIPCASRDESEEMWHLSLEGDWSVVVPLLLTKRESSTHYLDNEPWKRKLARTSTVVGP